jgi:hypothetical protein
MVYVAKRSPSNRDYGCLILLTRLKGMATIRLL